MATWIAFLRGVNVGGRTVPMGSLEAAFRALGFHDARAFRASGNIGFSTDGGRAPVDARELSVGISRVTKGPVELFLRRLDDLHSIDGQRPFADSRPKPAAPYITFLPEHFTGSTDARRLPSTPAAEIVLRGAREVLCWGHPVDGRPGFPNAYFERVLKVPTTTRNWSTVEGLLDRYRAIPLSAEGRRARGESPRQAAPRSSTRGLTPDPRQ